MYFGFLSDELKKAKDEYREMFGYDPDGEIEVEYGNDHDEYLRDINLCLKTKKHIADLYD